YDNMLREAVSRQASDMHIETGDKGVSVDFREFGELIPRLPLELEEGTQLVPSVHSRSETTTPIYLAHKVQHGRMENGPKIALPRGVGSLRHAWFPTGRGRWLATRIHYEAAVGLMRLEDQPFTEATRRV